MPVKTIYYDSNVVKLIDQTKLPGEFVYIDCKTKEDMWRAIRDMQVRGAPAIGVAAGFGLVLAMKDFNGEGYKEFLEELEKAASYFYKARPTAVNLAWALERVKGVIKKRSDCSVSELKEMLLSEAINILEEDTVTCKKIGEYGAELIKSAKNILTHCNAGGLATALYGTALGVLFCAKERGQKFHVYVDETRPVLQGARLTIWELMQENIDCTLICDNMAASLMRKGKIDAVIVGADRIAKNGDTANKIGTYSLACLCQLHKIPFYVAVPFSTFDVNISDGNYIPIEEREHKEVTHLRGMALAPSGVKVYNPAFDVTPADYITAFITEKGIIKPPYETNIIRLIKSKI